MIPAVVAAVSRERLLQVVLWLACAALLVGALAALIVPRGGDNRIAAAALPYALGAAALAARALMPNRLDTVIRSWVTALLFAASVLAAIYGVMLVAAVPLRLSIEGTCPPGPATCPLGFARPLSSGENLALEVTVVSGVIALLLTFMALEVHYRPRLRLRNRPSPPSSGPASGSQ